MIEHAFVKFVPPCPCWRKNYAFKRHWKKTKLKSLLLLLGACVAGKEGQHLNVGRRDGGDLSISFVIGDNFDGGDKKSPFEDDYHLSHSFVTMA